MKSTCPFLTKRKLCQVSSGIGAYAKAARRRVHLATVFCSSVGPSPRQTAGPLANFFPERHIQGSDVSSVVMDISVESTWKKLLSDLWSSTVFIISSQFRKCPFERKNVYIRVRALYAVYSPSSAIVSWQCWQLRYQITNVQVIVHSSEQKSARITKVQ